MGDEVGVECGGERELRPSPSLARLKPSTPLNLQRGVEEKKKREKKNWFSTRLQPAISTSARSPLSASSTRSLVSFLLRLLLPAPSPSSLPSWQVWAIHSDVRLTPSAFCCES